MHSHAHTDIHVHTHAHTSTHMHTYMCACSHANPHTELDMSVLNFMMEINSDQFDEIILILVI